MLWYKKLYVSEAAAKRRFTIIQKIRDGSAPPKAYVIVPASNPQNLLDIWQAAGMPKEKEEWIILGIAWGYQDALELAAQMADEIYRTTGTFDFNAYLGLDEYKALLKQENPCKKDPSGVTE